MIERLIRNIIGALIGLALTAAVLVASGAAVIAAVAAGIGIEAGLTSTPAEIAGMSEAPIRAIAEWVHKATQPDRCDYIAHPRGDGSYRLEAC